MRIWPVTKLHGIFMKRAVLFAGTEISFGIFSQVLNLSYVLA